MIVHGQFHSAYHRRPIVTGILFHPLVHTRTPLDFMVDTGADRTFLVPEHQELLQISSKHLVPVPNPIFTLAGPVQCDVLPGCTLVFNDKDNNPLTINNLAVYFLIQKKAKKKQLMGEGCIPSILGRDVLEKLALCYCAPSEQLFLTNETHTYYKLMSEQFPMTLLGGVTFEAIQGKLTSLNREIAALHEKAQVTLKRLEPKGEE